jgi:hypothetical protein
MRSPMKFASLGCLLACSLLFGGAQDSEFNINSKYTVDAVLVSGDGWTADVASSDVDGKVSSGLRKELRALIGEKLNPTLLDDLARRLRKEFHARTVEHRVLRGKSPDYVQVVFDIRLRPTRFDVSVPKFLYHSGQGWTGAIEGTATIVHHGVTVGLVSDGDELAERYTGFVARYENSQLGSEKVHFRAQFETYHEQWNPNTIGKWAAEASWAPALYRTRQNFEPEVRFQVAKPLTVSVGVGFQRFQSESPTAQAEAANVVAASAHYRRRLEDSFHQQDLDATYSFRAATRILGSDSVYARHRWEFRYMLTQGKGVFIDDLSGGIITGQAPLFERFILGNGTTLRGWNKYDLDPLGGNRMVHNSVEYRYGAFQVFYDSGSVWDRPDSAVIRHSVGVGLRQGVFSLAIAFPLKEGRIDPIVIMGMNY